MYKRFKLLVKYLYYYVSATNSKGHGVHSPFVFGFIKNVLNDEKQYPCYEKIEARRKVLQEDHSIIDVDDFGAGSGYMKSNERAISDIANLSLKPKKYAQLLYRIVHYYQPGNIVELGTSFGVTTAYMAFANENANVYTAEGDTSIAGIAQTGFRELKLKNIELVIGEFNNTLPALFLRMKQLDFAFIDANHRKEPTLQYFSQLLAHSTSSATFIFDDIHWSSEMEAAWREIKQHPAVTLTIDLFFIGLAFVNPEFKGKQHFTIRF